MKKEYYEVKECRGVKRLLDDFLSSELTPEMNRQIIDHLDTCDDCRNEKQTRETVRKVLKRSWDSIPVPRDLVDQVEAEIAAEEKTSSRIHLGLAASLLLAVGALAFFLIWPFAKQPVQVNSINHFREVVADHLECQGRPSEVFPLDSHREHLEEALSTTEGRFRLLEVAQCEVNEASFVHYVFRGNQGSLSLMLEKRLADQTLVERGERISLNDFELHLVEEGPMTVAAFTTERYFVYILADGFDHIGTIQLARIILPSIKEASI